MEKSRVLIIAKEEKANELAKKIMGCLKSPISSLAFYNLDGTYTVLEEGGRMNTKALDSRGPAEGIAKVIKETDSKEVFIAHPLPYDTIVDAILDLGRNSVKFMLSPEAYERCMGKVKRVNRWFFPAVGLTSDDLSPFYRITKRGMDISLSILILILLSPIFLIVPILIKLTSGGPIFFTQVRCGHNGRLFKIYKFRTMVPDAENILPKMIDFDKLKEPVFKLKNDPRVTFLGKILRKTSIDELPQLFNVLKGDLSLVGPRPEEIALVKKYNAFFKQRLKVKPGVTGLQQVTCRGSTSMMKRMKYDLAYIKNQSLWLDLKILFKTVWVVLLQKRAV